ncbi:phosphoribosylamine--glycine ligase [Sphingomonas endophytica]|uniref:Phosphoribosylamine--glycine ligase n=1 Tax=Sphingomonas endophytica TaxID=869719 RepID=A0ABR6N576_9SPHN|nr:phosphoribosylamine--glycine ligase [Sphingomonas endophytica]MBB5725380.1 phosphoribosylamine--glycine ligase [Sphingomonas endophytica]
MNILLVGSGGREHALAWKLAQSPTLDTLFAAPGNPGIAEHATIAELDVTDHRAVVDFVRRHRVGLVVIGPEAPLVDGLADNIRSIGVPVFGPGREAAKLEGSKGFTKDLCARMGIPTARYFRVTSKDGALACLDDFGEACVIKADGLAAGKGVVVATTRAEAEAAIADLYAHGPVEAVIEEMLEGPEASLFVLSDGTTTAAFGSAQDHKRVGDGDTGPNTGGMGAYSPAAVLTPELEERALGEIVRPTIDCLAASGTPYVGVLYAGLMLTADGPKLIEYNVRFGDPECQVLMMRYTGDLAALLLAVSEGRLADVPAPEFSDDVALTVVMAAENYPGTPRTGGTIAGIDAAQAEGAVVFQAGTALKDGQLVSAGGRVLAVTATGTDVPAAQRAAYAAVEKVDFPTGFFRRDIGAKAVIDG